jgi:hypothetical protein
VAAFAKNWQKKLPLSKRRTRKVLGVTFSLAGINSSKKITKKQSKNLKNNILQFIIIC